MLSNRITQRKVVLGLFVAILMMAGVATAPGGVGFHEPGLILPLALMVGLALAFPMVMTRKKTGNSSIDLCDSVNLIGLMIVPFFDMAVAISLGVLIGAAVRWRTVSGAQFVHLVLARTAQKILTVRVAATLLALWMPVSPLDDLVLTFAVLFVAASVALLVGLIYLMVTWVVWDEGSASDLMERLELKLAVVAAVIATSFGMLGLLANEKPLLLVCIAVPLLAVVGASRGQIDTAVGRERLNALLLAATDLQECETAREVEETLLQHGRVLFASDDVWVSSEQPDDDSAAVRISDGENKRWLVVSDEEFFPTPENMEFLNGLGSVGRIALRSVLLLESSTHAAAHDVLTGLANRREFTDAVDQQLSRAARSGERVGLLFADLDGFKPVNDEHGHHVGDELLKLVAERLQSVVRHGDVVGRFGGDEFVIMLAGVDEIDGIDAAAHKILDEIARPFEVSGWTLHIGVSSGVAIFPENGTDLSDLMAQADAALLQAKRAGKNTYRLSKGRPLDEPRASAETSAGRPM